MNIRNLGSRCRSDRRTLSRRSRKHRPRKRRSNACARAFASSLAAPAMRAPPFKVDYRGDAVRELDGRLSTPATYTFDLQANNPKTGLPIARASCSTDTRGVVIALSSLPLDGPRTGLAARTGAAR